VADVHDEASLQALEKLNLDALPKLDTDSASGLRLFLQLMRRDRATTFTLVHHSNSAKLTNDPAAPSTTSYITGLWTRP